MFHHVPSFIFLRRLPHRRLPALPRALPASPTPRPRSWRPQPRLPAVSHRSPPYSADRWGTSKPLLVAHRRRPKCTQNPMRVRVPSTTNTHGCASPFPGTSGVRTWGVGPPRAPPNVWSPTVASRAVASDQQWGYGHWKRSALRQTTRAGIQFSGTTTTIDPLACQCDAAKERGQTGGDQGDTGSWPPTCIALVMLYGGDQPWLASRLGY